MNGSDLVGLVEEAAGRRSSSKGVAIGQGRPGAGQALRQLLRRAAGQPGRVQGRPAEEGDVKTRAARPSPGRAAAGSRPPRQSDANRRVTDPAVTPPRAGVDDVSVAEEGGAGQGAEVMNLNSRLLPQHQTDLGQERAERRDNLAGQVRQHQHRGDGPQDPQVEGR